MATQYQCPECNSDMTKQVASQCELIVDRPLVVQQIGAEKKEPTPAACVTLQCPRGHWAEYNCPKNT
jgi:hypothetical protein